MKRTLKSIEPVQSGKVLAALGRYPAFHGMEPFNFAFVVTRYIASAVARLFENFSGKDFVGTVIATECIYCLLVLSQVAGTHAHPPEEATGEVIRMCLAAGSIARQIPTTTSQKES
jgi:hypothetical protein